MKLHLIVVFEVLFASMEITAENREYLWEVNINHSGQTLRMHTSRQFPVQIFKGKGKRKKQPCHAKNAQKKKSSWKKSEVAIVNIQRDV